MGKEKDIDFHLKEAISASQELVSAFVGVCMCVCLVHDLSWDHSRDWRHHCRRQACTHADTISEY